MARQDEKTAPTTAAPGMVKDLVEQFSNPLDFYRELIQNSIDAGSNRIDVFLDYVANDKGVGEAVIRVEDDGEGMDEHIIDNYLLVLFKSTKEDDFTKIGKFGIGFVSIFAIQPRLVRLYTAKNGESWRLDFPSYKKYDKYRLKEMRDGTLLELFKPMTREEYGKLIADSKQTIHYWCKHSEARIFFRDLTQEQAPEQISEPFALGKGGGLAYQEEGTEILLEFSGETEPFFGFYNRGLTLKEGKKQFFPGVQIRVKSRYLEHTLTRDNVMEDENYRKLMKIIKGLVDKGLRERAQAELVEIAGRVAARAKKTGEVKETPEELANEWARRQPFFLWVLSGFWSRREPKNWPVFPATSGKVISLVKVLEGIKEGGALYHEAEPNRVTEALQQDGIPVLVTGPWVHFVTSITGPVPMEQASSRYILPEVIQPASLPAMLKAFLATLRAVDASSGSKYREVFVGGFEYSGSCIKDRIFVTQEEAGVLTRADEHPRSSLLAFARPRPVVLLNHAHSFVQKLAMIHESRPGLAAYLCLKVLHLYDGHVPPDQNQEYSNLAEKVELKLLVQALKLDVAKSRPGAA